MAKRKDDPPKVSTIILPAGDTEESIKADLTKGVREKLDSILPEVDIHASDAAQRVGRALDNLEERVKAIEQDLSGETKPVPRDEIRAIVDKYSFNMNSASFEDDKIEKVVTEVKTAYPDVDDDVVMEVILEKMGRGFGREMAVLQAAESDKLPTEEDVERWGKMFTKVILADERGEEPDLSEFKQPVATAVETAVERYAANLKTPATENLHRRLHEMAGLFSPHPTNTRPENRSYRFLARRVKSRVSEDNIYFTMLFPDALTYDKEIDPAAVEKQMRRIDTELRELDSVARSEFVFNFVDEILSTENEGNTLGYRGWSTSDQFSMLSEESRRVVQQLVKFYFYTKHHFKMSQCGYAAVNREFNEATLQRLIELQDEKHERPYLIESNGGVRYIREPEYKLMLQLSKALYNALPDNFRDSVEAAMSVAKIPRPDITSATPNNAMITASKYLRTAFIAISQNRGSLENFFTAIYKFYALLDSELNQKVEIASHMVAVYDSLDLPIAAVLTESKKRVLEEPLF